MAANLDGLLSTVKKMHAQELLQGSRILATTLSDWSSPFETEEHYLTHKEAKSRWDSSSAWRSIIHARRNGLTFTGT